MNTMKLALAASLAAISGSALAAGPLYIHEPTMQPYRWDTSGGPIPVYTDGGPLHPAKDGSGDVQTFTVDGDNTAFLTVDQANAITAHAVAEWSNVSTSTFAMSVQGTIEEQLGIADVNETNVGEIYGAENGYGFWVNYDTDGQILEQYFGVPRSAVLGIAFPEWANEETGEIIEATALMNGWNVYNTDVNGDMVGGVFTHEFGHAINLSHTQVNGQLAYFSYTYAPKYPGPKGCVDPVHRWDYGPTVANRANPAIIETMFPFINHSGQAGAEQSTVEHPDDRAAISNLYPTADYLAGTGSITGTLRLKDGKTPYSGINVVARNVNDPLFDAVSNMTGSATQGLLGPDGRFTINGLTPGEQYVVYIEEIVAGGYPTTPMPIVSVSEYWDASESNDPATDQPCNATPITAVAGSPQVIDLAFNGYLDGVQYTPIVSAHLTDLAKNGKSAAGLAGSTAFIWDENHDFTILPADVAANNGQMTRNGQRMLVQYDFDGNGINQAAIVDFTGKSGKGSIRSLGDLNGDSCGSSSTSGKSSSYGWAIDDAGHTAVGLAYIDRDGDGVCATTSKGELAPWIWTAGQNGGMRELSMERRPGSTSWLRAQAISGNGRVVLGNNGGSAVVAWVDEGELINLYGLFGASDAYAVNYEGTRAALMTSRNGVVLWNPLTGDSENIGGLQYCVDFPATDFFGRDLCALYGPEVVQQAYGPVPVLPSDMNDDGTVIIGRAGSFRSGFMGAIWLEGLGWTNMKDFLYGQGVAEAFDFPMDNPISIDGSGDTLVGGLAGASFAWHVDMREVFVCDGGVTRPTPFPKGTVHAVLAGAELGRCEMLNQD